jgi:hypothetical protein
MQFLERLIVPFALIVAVLGLVYWYWTTTPSYALTQVATSLKNRDIETFQKFVDIDLLTSRAIDDVLHGPSRAGLLGKYDSMIGAGIISFFKPEIVAVVHREVYNAIQKGSLSLSSNQTMQSVATADGDTYNLRSVMKPVAQLEAEEEASAGGFGLPKLPKANKLKNSFREYGLSKEGFLGVDYLKTEGSNAFVGLRFHSPKLNRDFIIEFRMEDVGGTWKVTELSNVNELVKTYLESRSSHSPLPVQ